MAASHSFCLVFILSISFISANIIVIDEAEPDIHEYHCLPNESCIIRCLSSSACAESTLYCSAMHGCEITCDPGTANGSSACFESIIHAETAQYLSITVTAHLSNAQSMIIYAPHSRSQQSTVTCHSSHYALDQCNGLQIYTTSGFNDIQLLCNDATSACDISGAISCGYNRYSEDGSDYYHEIDECTHFEYKSNESNYQCANNSFCVDVQATTSKPSLLSTTIALISETSASLTNPTYAMKLVTIQEEDRDDIHALVLVVAGTSTVCCAVLIICAGCALIYIRFNREHVEDVLLRRYLSGKGSTLPYPQHALEIKQGSNDGSATSTISTVIENNEDVDPETEDSNDLGLVGFNSDAHSLNNHKYPGLIYEDELDNITNDININININNETNINMNASSDIKEEDAKKLILQLNTCDSGQELESNVSIQNSCSNHASINPEISSQDSRTSTISPRCDCYEEHKQLQENMVMYRGNDNDSNHSMNSAEIEKIPLPPPRERRLAPDLSDKQLEQRAQIHLDNIRNRQRCFGYLQAEILYEVDENFSSDDTNDIDDDDDDDDDDIGEEMKMTGNTTNAALPVVINTNDRHKSEDDNDCSESDDLLEDGVITIKIDSPHISISNRSSPVPPIRHIPRTSSSTIPRVPSLPPSLCPEMNDPEILSDDGQLPSLPVNGSHAFIH